MQHLESASGSFPSICSEMVTLFPRMCGQHVLRSLIPFECNPDPRSVLHHHVIHMIIRVQSAGEAEPFGLSQALDCPISDPQHQTPKPQTLNPVF
jgi:hypothetical protein